MRRLVAVCRFAQSVVPFWQRPRIKPYLEARLLNKYLAPKPVMLLQWRNLEILGRSFASSSAPAAAPAIALTFAPAVAPAPSPATAQAPSSALAHAPAPAPAFAAAHAPGPAPAPYPTGATI